MSNTEFQINQKVKIENYRTDTLKDCFGETGDGDYWEESDSKKQAKYVGTIGKVVDTVSCNNSQFCIVEFEDNNSFTFCAFDLSLSEEELTSAKLLSKTIRPSRELTDVEIKMAEEIFTKMVIRSDDQSIKNIEDIAILSCRAALIFNLSKLGKYYTDLLVY